MEKNIIIIIISRIIGCEHLEFRISHWDREFVQRLLIKCKESKSQPGQAAAAECCELHWLFDVFCQNFSTFDLYDSVERTPSEMYFYRQLSSPCGKCCAFIVILSFYLFVYILIPKRGFPRHLNCKQRFLCAQPLIGCHLVELFKILYVIWLCNYSESYFDKILLIHRACCFPQVLITDVVKILHLFRFFFFS